MIRGTLEPKSNRETFKDDIELFADGQQLDLTGCTAKIQLQRNDGLRQYPDYSPYPGYVGLIFAPTQLLATTENGAASVIGGQSIRFTFTLAQMATLSPGQYMLSVQVTSADGTMTVQAGQFQIPILDGGLPTP